MSFIKKILGKREKSFSDKLEELGYFKYSPTKEIKALKEKIDESYNQIQILSTPKDEKYRPIDLRYYFCDGESIHEYNGYKDYVDYISPSLEKLGILDKVKGNISDSSTANIDVDSVYNLIKSLNRILDENRISETWYPIYGGNDGQLILLTPELFEFLSESIKDAKSRPFEIEAWRKLVIYSKSEQSNINLQQEKKVIQGNRIIHAKYGHGVIKEINEKGLALIDFKEHGERKIIIKYAQYEIID